MGKTTFRDAVEIQGNLTVTGTIPTVARSSLVQENLAVYPIPWTRFRKHDDYGANLPQTPLTDDLGIVGGTFATDSPSLQTEDLKAAGSTSSYARFMVPLPAEYVAGETVQIRVRCGALTTVADTAMTVDVEAYESDKEAGIGADLCTTAATTCNSLTLADKDFSITATTLTAGDWLDVRLTALVNDGASGTAVKFVAGSVELLCDIKG